MTHGVPRSVGRLVLGVLLLRAIPAWAVPNDDAEIEKARNAFVAREYDEAERRLRALAQRDSRAWADRAALSNVRMLLAATLYAKNAKDEAEQIFEQLLLADPTYEPDPLGFPTEVVNALIDTRVRIREMLRAAAQESARREEERKRLEALRQKQESDKRQLLERLAGEETVVETHSRWVATLPFGIGQFQNGQRALGYAFLGTELAFASAALVATPFYLAEVSSAQQAFQGRQLAESRDHWAMADRWRTVNIAGMLALGAVALAGVAQAQWAFVPQHVTTRPRNIGPVLPRSEATWMGGPAMATVAPGPLVQWGGKF